MAALTAGSIPAYAEAPGTGPPTFRIDWTACAGAAAVQCGTLHVPLDWSEPTGERVPIAVARRPADNPAARVGTLFYNPGGPGDGGTPYIVNAEQIFSATLRARFDLVALDPRGMGDSVHVRCGLNPLTPATSLFPRSERQLEQQRRHIRQVARRQCVVVRLRTGRGAAGRDVRPPRQRMHGLRAADRHVHRDAPTDATRPAARAAPAQLTGRCADKGLAGGGG